MNFVVGTSEERPDLVGPYLIRYQIQFHRYPDNAVQTDTPFSVTVIDPCQENNIQITPGELLDQTYTITDREMIY